MPSTEAVSADPLRFPGVEAELRQNREETLDAADAILHRVGVSVGGASTSASTSAGASAAKGGASFNPMSNSLAATLAAQALSQSRALAAEETGPWSGDAGAASGAGVSAGVGAGVGTPTRARDAPAADMPNTSHYSLLFPSTAAASSSANAGSNATTTSGPVASGAVAAAPMTGSTAARGATSPSRMSSPSRRRTPLSDEVLYPDPIMQLAGVMGLSGERTSSVLFSPDGSELVYPCASMVVAMSFARPDGTTTPRRQRHFLGHTAPITCLAVSRSGERLASAQECPSAIRVWDFARARCLAVLGGFQRDVTALSFSDDGRMLLGMGVDDRARTVMIVWDVSDVGRGRHEVVARQVSDFPITSIRFSPYDLTRLVSCGRENVRFWRVTKAHLRGCPVILRQFARSCTYTDLAFESGYGARAIEHEAQRRVFVSSDAGTVLQVNYETRELECVFRLHDNAIHSLAVNEGFCVTASADHFLRVWPLDFSDFFLEAQHKGPVTSASVSPDGLNIAVGTAGGTIGVLDISSHAYHTLLRAHTATVNDIAVRSPPGEAMAASSVTLGAVGTDGRLLVPSAAEAEAAAVSLGGGGGAAGGAGGGGAGGAGASSGFLPEIATVSSDGTIRVWSLLTWDPLYEFESPGQVPLCVAYHPTKHVIAVGFESGHLRVFDIPSTSYVRGGAWRVCAGSRLEWALLCCAVLLTRVLLACCAMPCACCLDGASYTSLLQEYQQHACAVRAVAFLPDGALAYSAAEDGSIGVYDCNHGFSPIKMANSGFPRDQYVVFPCLLLLLLLLLLLFVFGCFVCLVCFGRDVSLCVL